MDPVVLDRIIEKLVEVRSSKPGKLVQLSESEIKQLCSASREIFINQPNLLELEAPIKICGKFSLFLLSIFCGVCLYVCKSRLLYVVSV